MKIASFIILSLLPVAFSQKPLSSASSNLEENVRVKRAGFSLITGAIQNLQKNAFGASASLSAGSSSSSSGSSGHSSLGHSSSGSSSSHDSDSHSYDSHSHDYDHNEPQHDTKSFDGWQLKKSILNTLLQAVKAIAGGVTTLKGQLIKGSGYLVSQQGKLLASAGDSVSDAGKSIIKSAHLIKPESSGHGHGQSIGHSLGSKFGGLTNTLTKSISGLSSGSAGSITSLSSSSSAHGSGSSSGSSSGHSSGGSSSHGEESYTDDHHSQTYNIPESNNYGSYDGKLESYGPPKIVHESYVAPQHTYFEEPQSAYGVPQSAYGVPQYNDGSYKSSSNHQEASDVLDGILRNLPHKPMKVGYQGYSGGHSFNQLPIPNDLPPPFKPLNTYSSYNIPFESHKTINSEYGPPPSSHYSDYHGQASNKKSVAVNPKAYDIYHTMTNKRTKDKNYVTLPPTKFDKPTKGLEILKSIEYEIKA